MTSERIGIVLMLIQQLLFTVDTAAIHRLAGSVSLWQLGLFRSIGGVSLALCSCAFDRLGGVSHTSLPPLLAADPDVTSISIGRWNARLATPFLEIRWGPTRRSGRLRDGAPCLSPWPSTEHRWSGMDASSSYLERVRGRRSHANTGGRWRKPTNWMRMPL